MGEASLHGGPASGPGPGTGPGTGGTGRGASATFHERLLPSPATWLLVPLGGAFGAATGYVGGPLWALVGGVVLAAVVAAALVSASTVVSLSADGVLRVARAHVEVEHLTGAVAARGERARSLRGPELDGRTHLHLRGWVEPVVLVGLGDPEDPTPSWLFSSRRPEDLVAALAQHGVSGPVATHVPARSQLLDGPDGLDASAPRPELGPGRGALRADGEV